MHKNIKYIQLVLLLTFSNMSLQTFAITPSIPLEQYNAVTQYMYAGIQATKNITPILSTATLIPSANVLTETPHFILQAGNIAAAKIGALCSYAYLPYMIAGGAIVAGGGYYWYNHEKKKIDYTPNYDPKYPRCEIPGMIGACPPTACTIIKQLTENSNSLKNGLINSLKTSYVNILVLEGPTGTGKTTLAEAIARESNCNYKKIMLSNVANRYIGGSKDAINEQISLAIAEAEADDRCVVILVDEADGLVSDESSEAHSEYVGVYMALLDQIDTHKRDPRVYFVFATNNYKKLPVTLQNRISSQIIHMKNPDAEQRTALLNHFSDQITKKKLTEYCSGDCVQKLIRETKNFSIRNIEGIFESAQTDALNMNQPISRANIMHALNEIKIQVQLQNETPKAEQEKANAIYREKENLWWHRIHGIIALINIYEKIPSPEIPNPWK